MNITKYNHACLVIEKGGQRLVIDPGVWSDDFVAPENVAGIIITHEHPDHLDIEKLEAITELSPSAIVYAHPDVVAKIEGHASRAVRADEVLKIDDFTLRFTGGQHAAIHSSYPTVANLGVVIDDALYYPGDSFSLPDATIHTLALPVAAPWLKISEVMNFLDTVKPIKVFPTHDAILSQTGQELVDRMLSTAAKQTGARYERLLNGTAVEL